mgnify:CR=1 FL=1
MFHFLHTTIEPPSALNNPFCYEPHALTLLASRLLTDHLRSLPGWAEEIAAGKMFGVLVCRDGEGRLGFLAAYSGQVAGRADWPWFVPAVFDYLQPDGHFRQEEARISALNWEVGALESSVEYAALREALQHARADGDTAIESYRRYVRECKRRRDERRAGGQADEAVLVAESQYQKAELRRLKRHWQEQADRVEEQLRPLVARIDALKRERRQRSDALQQWLFDHFVMLNDRGERRSLTAIFAATPQGTPPSGAGECCGPKLLQYAFLHQLQPLCMGEFWRGRSPQMEVRHHGQFYPACRGKCKPILEWMLGMGRTAPAAACHAVSGLPMAHGGELRIVCADESIVVVSKPSGLLSVPGKQGLPSVESILGGRYGRVYMPHRLDQDTSGLLVVARTMGAYHHLQRQFLERTVRKEYEALLDGIASGEGTISLPLRPDLDDRPRQLVDREHGKAAVTAYRVTGVEEGRTHILLVPHTGRTHQLRVHCAHQEGLATPIVGDSLYGRPGDGGRLCLHARLLAFRHPDTGQELVFSDPAPF